MTNYSGVFTIQNSHRRISIQFLKLCKAQNGNGIIIAPNLVADYTTISFKLLQKQKTLISIYDMSGRLVKILANAELQAGTHELTWNVKDEKGIAVSAGIYFLKLQTSNYSETRKLIVEK